VAVYSGANPANDGRFVATANGTEGVKNIVVATVTRTNIPSTAPGAIYLVNDAPTDSIFNGNAFGVDGNDHHYTGGMGTAPPVPGISTRNATNATEAINSLTSDQKDNVTGLGFSTGPPVVPSVWTSPAAPSLTQAEPDHHGHPRASRQPAGPADDNSSNINGNQTYGTPASPQITHLTGNNVKMNGNATGCGIMIVEGDSRSSETSTSSVS